MRLLHLRWDHLPLLLEHPVSARSELVVLGGKPWDPGSVLDASPAALRAGVVRGQPLGSAHALVPDALFLEPHRDRYRDALEAALETLVAVTPAVEGTTRWPYWAKKMALISSDLPRENSATKATDMRSSRRWSMIRASRAWSCGSESSDCESQFRYRSTASSRSLRQRP